MFLDAGAFLRTDQSEFGTAWRHELVRGAIVAHAYRREGAGWSFEWVAGEDGVVTLRSVGITVPLAALYERVPIEEEQPRPSGRRQQWHRLAKVNTPTS